MASFNKVILMGNLTRDPELRQTPTGAKVAELRLAVSETWRDKSGQPKEVTCFVDVVVWEKLAELCQQYLAKGRPVLVEGRLQMDEWKNQQGETRSKLRVRADTVKFVGPPPSRPGETPTAARPAAADASASVADRAEHNVPDDLTGDDEHIPF
ncbi:MAG: single-stranded DNA-binding protein [Kiritimatiellia bacterium]|jgi:single-strand DNA-binding protein|nr:single-stranded DNA-binding protein [Kiritimatiellia bacterium]